VYINISRAASGLSQPGCSFLVLIFYALIPAYLITDLDMYVGFVEQIEL